MEDLEKSKIVNPAMFLDALKNSGYRGTDNAVAEIVDNSIDAHASNVFIIGEQSKNGNNEKGIVSFAFLDDGDGMDYNTLKSCLTLGYTTNAGKKGIGRFGVGLPQASIFVCNHVEVYSWQNGIDNCMSVYLDYDEIKASNLNDMEAPVKKAIPDKYKKFINWKDKKGEYNFSAHGTLVVWDKCTNVNYRKWTTCVNHMRFDLGRKYRYHLYEGKKSIKMIELVSLNSVDLLPNDPLYLMVPSLECVPSDISKFISDGYITKEYGYDNAYNESLFELYKPNEDSLGYQDLPIVYEQNEVKKTGNVRITYSVVKRKYYSPQELKTTYKPGQLPYGKKGSILEKNIGISMVRNGREIQFDDFGFFDIYNTPEHRWWGIEVSFGSELDEAFGVSNNKQSVDLRPLSKEEMQEASKDEIKTVWHQLAGPIMSTIKAMNARNSKIRGEEPNVEDATPATSSAISTKVDSDEDDFPGSSLSEEEKEAEAKEQLTSEGVENPTDSQVKKFIDSNVRVTVVYNKSKNDSFVDAVYAAGTLSILLNANHNFYVHLVKKIMDNQDDKVAFELFLMAIVKSIKNLERDYSDAMDALMYQLNRRITEYMLEYIRIHE